MPGGRQAGQPGRSLRETADHAKTIGLGRRGSVAGDRTTVSLTSGPRWSSHAENHDAVAEVSSKSTVRS